MVQGTVDVDVPGDRLKNRVEAAEVTHKSNLVRFSLGGVTE